MVQITNQLSGVLVLLVPESGVYRPKATNMWFDWAPSSGIATLRAFQLQGYFRAVKSLVIKLVSELVIPSGGECPSDFTGLNRRKHMGSILIRTHSCIE